MTKVYNTLIFLALMVFMIGSVALYNFPVLSYIFGYIHTNHQTELINHNSEISNQIINSVNFKNGTLPEFVDTQILEVYKQVNYLQPRRNGIVIMAGYHTGSSFTGSIFRSSKDVFYMFEPLSLICLGRNWKKERFNQKYMSNILQDLLNCNPMRLFKTSQGFLPDLESQRRNWIRRIFQNLKTMEIYYSDTNCSDTSDIIQKQCMKTTSVSVVKAIRIDTVTSILPLIFAGVKVLNVVRDPRGLARSRFKRSMKTSQMLEHMSLECRKQARNVRFLKQAANIPDIHNALMANFRLVRYEDIAYDPVRTSERMYKFAGLSIGQEVTDFVQKFAPLDGNISKSRQIASYWKYVMDFDIVKQIEDICRESMENLGFLTYEKEEEYKDDANSALAAVSTEIPYVFH